MKFIDLILEKFKQPKIKKIVALLCVIALVAWVVFRFVVIAQENSQTVFNQSRENILAGAPVRVINVSYKTDNLQEPISVKNNRAMVSGARINKLYPGQKIGDGK